MEPALSNADATRWYVLYLRSRHERVVDSRLREKGVETLLPLIEGVRQYSDRKKKVMEPLFRGYLFVRMDLRSRIHVVQTDGVVNIVGLGRQPSPIPDDQIEWIRIAMGNPSKIHREPCLSRGETVRIAGGPFAGIQGSVLCQKDSQRVVIFVDCIGQGVSVEVLPGQATRLSA